MRLPKVVRVTGQVFAWLVILGASAVVATSVLVPRLAGATPYVIETGSMRPSMPPGTLVVVRPSPARDLGPGDVITYQARPGVSTVVTHRIVAQGMDGTDHPVFRTRGDANAAPDQRWVRPVQIKGERWYSVPLLGYVTSGITGAQRHRTLIGVVTILCVYSVWMFANAARERCARARSPQLEKRSP